MNQSVRKPISNCFKRERVEEITTEKDENRSENIYLECFQIQIVTIICKNIGSDMAAGKFVHNQL